MKRFLLFLFAVLLFSPCYSYAADTAYYQYNVAIKLCDNGDGTYSQCVKLVGAAGTSTTLPVPATTTTASGTVATANTYQTILNASATRKGCLVTNKSTSPIFVYVGLFGAATANNSVILNPGTATADGGSFSCNLVNGVVLTDAISVTSATQGALFNVMSQ